MDDRHLSNPYDDYYEEKHHTIIKNTGKDINSEFREKLSSGTKVLLQRLEKHQKDWCNLHEYTVYIGLPGIAYMFYHYGQYFEDQNYIAKAAKWIKETVDGMRCHRHVSFLTGSAGLLALGAVINHLHVDKEESKNMISKLKSLSPYVVDDGSGVPDELLYGRAGYLYSLMFVNKYIFPAPIEGTLIKLVINRMINSGKGYSRARGCKSPLMYMWHDTEYLGGAHGLAGILYMLLQAREYVTEYQLRTEIEPAVQWLEKNKFPSGNFPPCPGGETDRLVHWCHGAPAMTMLFCLAYEVFKLDHYLSTALECGEVVWQRGLLKKGCGLCHGVAGNAYTFLSLFHLTKDAKHLYRACKFAEWCLDYDAHQQSPADSPFSLFEGLAGTIYFLVDMQKPDKAKFPGYTV